MSLSPPPAATSAAAAAAAAAASVLLGGNNMSRMEDHLLTRFQHIDPELVDEYMSGRRRQVSSNYKHDIRKSFCKKHKEQLFVVHACASSYEYIFNRQSEYLKN